CIGVVPAACPSFSRGREIFPSGRTGTEREMSGSFQTLISSTSSGPITYSVSAAGAMASETGFFAGCFCPPAARTQRGAAASTRKRIIHVLFIFFHSKHPERVKKTRICLVPFAEVYTVE